LGKDLYKSFVNPQATDERLLQVAKAAAIACGVAGAILASFLPTVISALRIFYNFVVCRIDLAIDSRFVHPEGDG
jgi:SSS family solute:Na+ symporter